MLAAILSLSVCPLAFPQEAQQPSSVPDAPAPQPSQAPLATLGGPIKPGGGAGTENTSATSRSADVQPRAPATTPVPNQTPPPPVKPPAQTPPPSSAHPRHPATTFKL